MRNLPLQIAHFREFAARFDPLIGFESASERCPCGALEVLRNG